MEEIWIPVRELVGLYEVSNWGRVRSVGRWVDGKNGSKQWKNGRILSLSKKHSGYLNVTLSKDGTLKTYRVHRLVAQAFLPNPDGLPIVNHKDEVKTNNYVDNLEWCDYKYSINYGTRNETVRKALTNGKLSKHVYQKTLDGQLVRVWPSTAECGRNGFDYSSVSRCCRGIYKQYKGYKWSYTNDCSALF